MGFIARSSAALRPLGDAVALEARARLIPPALIQTATLTATRPTARRRKLPTAVTLLLCLAMGLWAREALPVVLHRMTHGLCLFWPDPEMTLATKSALSQARSRLGARPLVELFHQVCQPLATPQTPGAFLAGLRPVALDGTTEDVPDSPANVRAFGRHHGDRGDSAFPQVQGVYLAECGTHAILDAGFWPAHVSERVGALRLLRRVSADMLVLMDRGFYSHEMTRADAGHRRSCPWARPCARASPPAPPLTGRLVRDLYLSGRP